MHPGREIIQFQAIFRGVCMYQFPLQLLIKYLHHRENIASGLKNIFVHPGREIVQFYVIFIGLFFKFFKYVVDMKLSSKKHQYKKYF